jgi:hypothetical protein
MHMVSSKSPVMHYAVAHLNMLHKEGEKKEKNALYGSHYYLLICLSIHDLLFVVKALNGVLSNSALVICTKAFQVIPIFRYTGP